MEAPSTLSQEQKLCLESVYTFLQGATVYLQAVASVVCPEDEAQLKALVELGSLCLSRLPEYFPEVRPLVLSQAARPQQRPLLYAAPRDCTVAEAAQKRKGQPPGSIGWMYGDGVFESGRGKQPATLKALKEANEKRKRGSK